jgi:hypothetical protein
MIGQSHNADSTCRFPELKEVNRKKRVQFLRIAVINVLKLSACSTPAKRAATVFAFGNHFKSSTHWEPLDLLGKFLTNLT